jgi:hypothetical protein
MNVELSREGQLLGLLEQKRGYIARLERRIAHLEALCAEAAAAVERGYHDKDTPALVTRLRGEGR